MKKKEVTSKTDLKEEGDKVEEIKIFDAFELNELDYDEAIIHDKRPFAQI